MSRRSTVPSYRLHRQSGQAIVTLPDGLGGRRDVLLGPHGTTASRQEYARVLAEWEANGRRLPQEDKSLLSINELALAFLEHAEHHYRHADGTHTEELKSFKLSLRPLVHLYGPTPAADLGPLALKAVRKIMVDGYRHPKHGAQRALARGVVNQRIGRIRRMFRWGVENEMVPAITLQALEAVQGLQKGRSTARETEPVRPVAEALVLDTLAHVNRHVRAMILVQLHTGARPGEVCVMRACDLDVSGPVWLYRPARHKTTHHGHGRVIAIGPKAQEVLRDFLTLDTQAYLFSPARAMEEVSVARRQARKTRLQPSQQNRRKKSGRRRPGERYTTQAYGKAIRYGVLAANKARACKECKSLKPEDRCETCKAAALPVWHPHQLRHTKATEIRREFGLDAARACLGHRTPSITEHYAEIDSRKSQEVMEKLG